MEKGGENKETISDGFDDGPEPGIDPKAYLARFEEVGSRTLKEVMKGLADSGRAVDCVVYDPFLAWALRVAKEAGAAGAAFFTQSCAVDQIYHHVYSGDLKVPLSGEEIRIPGLPPLRPEDMPSFVYAYGTYPPLFEIVVNQFDGLEEADWLFFNTFYELEQEVLSLSLPREKLMLWDRLSLVVEQEVGVNVCIIGDFNSILEVGERVGVGGPGDGRERREFRDFVEKANLIDVKIHGRKFTWYMSNGSCKSRIDRALVNEKWLEVWNDTSLRGLPRTVSDHCAICWKN
ncbi:hypothetical protein OROMI_033777 [Orobanche minor]